MPGIGSVACPKEITRFGDRRLRKSTERLEQRHVYRDVDARDGRARCRCCGRHPRLGGGHTHNHLRPRSLSTRADKHTLRNVHGCCLECNLLMKNGKIRVIGTDCRRPLAFRWTALATVRERAGLVLRDER